MKPFIICVALIYLGLHLYHYSDTVNQTIQSIGVAMLYTTYKNPQSMKSFRFQVIYTIVVFVLYITAGIACHKAGADIMVFFLIATPVVAIRFIRGILLMQPESIKKKHQPHRLEITDIIPQSMQDSMTGKEENPTPQQKKEQKYRHELLRDMIWEQEIRRSQINKNDGTGFHPN